MKENCWEHLKCGREPGGMRVEELGVCPAATESDTDGLNHGKNGGRLCWSVAGTFCGGQRQGAFSQKLGACIECGFFAKVREEEDKEFSLLIPGREVEEVAYFLTEIRRREETIRELATPIIPMFDRIIAVPLVGVLDTSRARELMRALLAGIREHRAKVVILDVTGVPLVDSAVANHLHKTILAARLKGVQTIVTGISDAVAETIVDLGIDWSSVRTMADVRTGLVAALGELGITLSKDDQEETKH